MSFPHSTPPSVKAIQCLRAAASERTPLSSICNQLPLGTNQTTPNVPRGNADGLEQGLTNYGPRAESSPVCKLKLSNWNTTTLTHLRIVYGFFHTRTPKGRPEEMQQRLYGLQKKKPRIFTIWAFIESLQILDLEQNPGQTLLQKVLL